MLTEVEGRGEMLKQRQIGRQCGLANDVERRIHQIRQELARRMWVRMEAENSSRLLVDLDEIGILRVVIWMQEQRCRGILGM